MLYLKNTRCFSGPHKYCLVVGLLMVCVGHSDLGHWSDTQRPLEPLQGTMQQDTGL